MTRSDNSAESARSGIVDSDVQGGRKLGPPMPASFFDVDGTLVRTNLLHPTVFYLANQNNPLSSLRAIARAALGGPRMAVAEMLDRRRFNELLFAVYAG